MVIKKLEYLRVEAVLLVGYEEAGPGDHVGNVEEHEAGRDEDEDERSATRVLEQTKNYTFLNKNGLLYEVPCLELLGQACRV
jgi:hypothetical protein